ncbi:hypothetical protein NW768_010823 [Fusarium equiseti]|uniref:Nephrocystin 3-like N-terminal domain-containing protein n=1 Tax=Fusarium equiseti TaxID=61235 RepID=A0ABQ8QZH5_FUSEQ|nr:hypothetical protein NW768_010823 [Fusarium equiseti]
MSSPASQSSRQRQSIGIAILCPRESEARSIIALFDEHHADQSYGSTVGDDPNQYSIGTTAQRDVVVAYRPDADQSLSGDIAKWCRKSFTNVHLALVVGICSGLHNYIDSDILAGDVVIAARLMHYDQEGDMHSIISTLPKSGKGKEVLEMRYFLQKQKQHESKSATENFARSEDVQPGAEEGDSNERTRPKVYYGSLTSGSMYMNSRAIRLAEETGVLGVDVGSLDVSKVFPCVVIKGISNYGDGYQKPEWLDSAGQSAAASTRTLLENWNTMLRVGKSERKSLLKTLRFPVLDDRENEILDQNPTAFAWMQHGDLEEDTKISEAQESRRKEWFKLKDWMISQEPIYWIAGNTGSGKSTFLARLLERWPSNINVVSHFFWELGSSKQKSFKGFLCSLLHQLLSNDFTAGDILREKMRAHPGEVLDDWDEMKLESILLHYRDNAFRKLYIMIDGLDEAAAGDMTKLLDFINLSATSEFKICVLSYPDGDFLERLKAHCVLDMHEFSAPDIEAIARDTVAKVATDKRSGFDIDALVLDIAESAKGVFLWGVMASRLTMRDMNDGDSDEEIIQELWKMPGGMEGLWNYIKKQRAIDGTLFDKYLSITLDLLFNHRAELTVFEVMMAVKPKLLEDYIVKNKPVSAADMKTKYQACKRILERLFVAIFNVEKKDGVRTVMLAHDSVEGFFRRTKTGRDHWTPSRLSEKDMRILDWKLRLASCRFFPNDRLVNLTRLTTLLEELERDRPDDYPPELIKQLFEMTWRQIWRGNLLSTLEPEPRDDLMPFPRAAKPAFLIELATLYHYDFVCDTVHTLNDSDEHDTMYCVLYHMCTNYILENENKALNCIFDILNKEYNPNWNIAQNTTAGCFGTPWVQFLLLIINLPRSPVKGKDTAISHWVSLFIKLFLDRGASLEMRLPVVFWPGVGPFTGNYAKSFYGLDKSKSRYLFLEMNVMALIELIASLRRQSGSSIHRGYTLPDVQSYMRVIGFKGGADEKISVVTEDVYSNLLVEEVREMCDVELEDHGQSRKQMSERADACTRMMEKLAKKCPSATEELCWKGTPWRLYT